MSKADESKESPNQIEARTKVKEIYLRFAKDLNHQNAAATLTLAIVMKELQIELVRFVQKEKSGNRPYPENQTVPASVGGHGNVTPVGEPRSVVGDGNGQDKSNSGNITNQVSPSKKNKKNANS